MQNSGRMPSFIATRWCLIYLRLPTIKCLCVCTQCTQPLAQSQSCTLHMQLIRHAWAELCIGHSSAAAQLCHRDVHHCATGLQQPQPCSPEEVNVNYLPCFWWQQLTEAIIGWVHREWGYKPTVHDELLLLFSYADTRKPKVLCPPSHWWKYLVCLGSNIFRRTFPALFLHDSCWRSAGHQECQQTTFPITRRMWPKKNLALKCAFDKYVTMYMFSKMFFHYSVWKAEDMGGHHKVVCLQIE